MDDFDNFVNETAYRVKRLRCPTVYWAEGEKCFAYRDGICGALDVNECMGKACHTYKTLQQVAEEKQKTIDRLHSLDSETQAYIIDKYRLDVSVEWNS